MTSLGELGESGLIEAIRPSLAVAGEDLLVGPGEDDAAAWREPEGVLVGTSDAFVEGVHFDRRWLRPAEIGWRCLALALGDLACKGAAPSQALISLALPPGWSVEEVTELYSGIAALAGRTGPALVGGDLVASPHDAVVCIAALGRARWPVVPRSAARPGWTVAVTGRLGGAGAALAAALAGSQPAFPEWEVAFRRPVPRIAEGMALAARGLAAGDVSDGLVREMEKFAAASGAGCRIHLGAVPRAVGVAAEDAIASGEETELVCAGPRELVEAAAAELECGLTVVGEMTASPGVAVLDARGREVALPHRGHEHFR